MVFEQLFSEKSLFKHPILGFILGACYTIIGIFIGTIIYSGDPSVIALGFTAIMLMPSLFKLTNCIRIREKNIFSFKLFLYAVFPLIKIYILIFFGIFFTFAFFSTIFPTLASGHFFNVQVSALAGEATRFNPSLWTDLFTRNFYILALSFLLSLIAGNGAILFITWNASIWGAAFGFIANKSSAVLSANPFILFGLIVLSVLPHSFLEALSYIIAAISGSIISDGLVHEKLFSNQMLRILKYNAILFILSIGILAIGMVIEAYVLGNFTVYRIIRGFSKY